MSIDKLIADLMSTVVANTASLDRVAANQERLIAGQEAAIAKIDGGAGAPARKPRETAAEKKAREEAEKAAAGPAEGAAVTDVREIHPLLAPANGETKKNAKQEDEPTANYRAADFTRQEVKNEFIGWLGDTTDADERKRRAGFVGEIAQHFGVKQPFAPAGGLTDTDQFKQTLFYLRRKREGLKVDFSADYDFNGDPLADQTVEASEADDDALSALG